MVGIVRVVLRVFFLLYLKYVEAMKRVIVFSLGSGFLYVGVSRVAGQDTRQNHPLSRVLWFRSSFRHT